LYFPNDPPKKEDSKLKYDSSIKKKSNTHQFWTQTNHFQQLVTWMCDWCFIQWKVYKSIRKSKSQFQHHSFIVESLRKIQIYLLLFFSMCSSFVMNVNERRIYQKIEEYKWCIFRYHHQKGWVLENSQWHSSNIFLKPTAEDYFEHLTLDLSKKKSTIKQQKEKYFKTSISPNLFHFKKKYEFLFFFHKKVFNVRLCQKNEIVMRYICITQYSLVLSCHVNQRVYLHLIEKSERRDWKHDTQNSEKENLSSTLNKFSLNKIITHSNNPHEE
jgi:hypothetical protein